MQKLFPVVFCSHGGGPCFWMDWDPPELFHGLRRYFENLPNRLPRKPAAIVVISAHWEEDDFTIQSADSPEMIFDYFGFPAHTYNLKYPASGASQEFDQWLNQTLCQSSPESRRQSLLNWSNAPQARRAHPREEHLMPLLVCAGAAEAESCNQTYSEKLPSWNVQTSCFEFGSADS